MGIIRALFGNLPVAKESRLMPLIFGIDKKEDFQPRTKGGYAAQPGTGPAGEYCKTCKHIYRNEMGKTYFKCALMQHVWTHGPGSDIKANSPSCRRWEKPAKGDE